MRILYICGRLAKAITLPEIVANIDNIEIKSLQITQRFIIPSGI